MQLSTRTNLVQDVTSPAGGAAPERPLYEFTAEQVAALEATRAKLNFTAEEIEERQRKTQASLEWIAAADTLQEQQRRGDRVWDGTVERPRATRRIQAARRPRAVAVVAPRARPVAAPRERREASSSRTSGQDPGDDDGEPPRGRRLDSRAEILEWAEERRRVLSALVDAEGLGRRQLSLDEEAA